MVVTCFFNYLQILVKKNQYLQSTLHCHILLSSRIPLDFWLAFLQTEKNNYNNMMEYNLLSSSFKNSYKISRNTSGLNWIAIIQMLNIA